MSVIEDNSQSLDHRPGVIPVGRQDSDGREVEGAVRARLFGADLTDSTSGAGVEPATRSPGRSPELTRGTVVGRYVLLDKLGAGGMGIVYAAYDPELDRKVALKLLLPGRGGSESGRARLLREAQALAKLTHPNVVAIHDVGTHDQQIWIAMEFVPGQTLGAWVKERPRRWPELLGVLTDVVRGVAAAHVVGLVHRDLKPENVMIGRDGRVRVMDFGLAHGRSLAAAEQELSASSLAMESAQSDSMLAQTLPGDSSLQPEVAALALRLTQAGSIQGTPAYMAPEQWRGEEATAAADQFGWSVMAWELLYGERPFHGENVLALAANVVAGRRRPPRKGRSVPGWLRRVMERGLAGSAEQRWPTMAALLAELERRRAPLVYGVAIVAAGSALVLAWPSSALDPRAMCAQAGARVAELWDADTRERLHERVLASKAPGADTAAATIVAGLDTYANALRSMRIAACEATHLRGEQSLDLLDRRMACLDRRGEDLRATVALFAAVEADAVESLARAVEELPKLAACADPEYLRAAWPLPDDPALRRAALETRAQLAEIKASLLAGRFAAAEQLARTAAASTGAQVHLPFAAEAAHLLAVATQERGQLAEAERGLSRALHLADAARDDALRVDVLFRLARNADERGRPDDVQRTLDDLAAVVRRVGTPEARAQHVEMSRAFARSRGELARAVELARSLLALREQIGQPLQTAEAAAGLGAQLLNASRYAEAEPHLRRAQESLARLLGPEHPNQARILANLAAVRMGTGHPDEALPMFQEALEILVAAGLGEQPEALTMRNAIVAAWTELGRYDEAYAELERLLVRNEKALGVEARQVGTLLYNLGDNRQKAGDLASAVAWLRKALAHAERNRGPDHIWTANCRWGLAAALLEQGDPDEALPLLVAALPVQLAETGPDSDDTSFTRLSLARAYLDLGRPSEALPHAEACQDYFTDYPDLVDRANARLYLARALHALSRDPGRVTELAKRAREDFAAARHDMGLAAVDRLHLVP